MPETNFTGYQFKDIPRVNKYTNNDNNIISGVGLGSGGSLLAHKYGGSISNSQNIHNENNANENLGISGAKNIESNYIEEEYPRTLAQPQSQVIRK